MTPGSSGGTQPAAMAIHVRTGVAGASVRLQEAADIWLVSVTDAAGNATLSLPGGPRDSHLVVTAAGYQEAQRHVDAAPDLVIDVRPLVPLVQPLPVQPTRDEILSALGSFQGLTVETEQYGRLPWFDPFIGSLERRSDRQKVYTAKHAAGHNRFTFALSYAYREPAPNVYEKIPGRDFSNDLPALHALMREAICEGFVIDLRLAGDGEGEGPGYNNDVGDTYGRGWLMANFLRIHTALADLDPWTIYTPGFDGVWYGWASPDGVREWLLFARSIVGPSGYLGIEWQTGKIHLGDSEQTYSSPSGQCLDVIFVEFPAPLESDWGATWQVGARLLGPAYRRPSNQPADNDPGPTPWYLRAGTPRGRFFVHADEVATYLWVRNRCTLADVQRWRDYLKSVGFEFVG